MLYIGLHTPSSWVRASPILCTTRLCHCCCTSWWCCGIAIWSCSTDLKVSTPPPSDMTAKLTFITGGNPTCMCPTWWHMMDYLTSLHWVACLSLQQHLAGADIPTTTIIIPLKPELIIRKKAKPVLYHYEDICQEVWDSRLWPNSLSVIHLPSLSQAVPEWDLE